MENRETGAPNRAEKKEESDKKQKIKKCHSTKRKTPMETCLKGILVVNWNVHWGGWWKGDGRAQGVKFAAAAASLQHRQIPNNEEPQRESHRQIIHKSSVKLRVVIRREKYYLLRAIQRIKRWTKRQDAE